MPAAFRNLMPGSWVLGVLIVYWASKYDTYCGHRSPASLSGRHADVVLGAVVQSSACGPYSRNTHWQNSTTAVPCLNKHPPCMESQPAGSARATLWVEQCDSAWPQHAAMSYSRLFLCCADPFMCLMKPLKGWATPPLLSIRSH